MHAKRRRKERSNIYIREAEFEGESDSSSAGVLHAVEPGMLGVQFFISFHHVFHVAGNTIIFVPLCFREALRHRAAAEGASAFGTSQHLIDSQPEI